MNTTLLQNLVPDFWRLLDAYISPFELARLQETGCRRLFKHMRHGISTFIYRPGLQRRYVLPSLFYHFPNLLYLEIYLSPPSKAQWLKMVDCGDIMMYPRSLKSISVCLGSAGDPDWPRRWLSKLPSNTTLASQFPNLDTFVYDNRGWDKWKGSGNDILSFFTAPLNRLELGSTILVDSDLLGFRPYNSNLSVLRITLPTGSLFQSTHNKIVFPCNLFDLFVQNLPAKFQLSQLPRSLLTLYIEYAARLRRDSEFSRTVDLKQLTDWPNDLQSINIYFGDGAITDGVNLTAAVASSLPRSLVRLRWDIDYFESAEALRNMPPNLTECTTLVWAGTSRLIQESIIPFPKSLTTIHCAYLSDPAQWKNLPRTITNVYGQILFCPLNGDNVEYIRDLPPLLKRLDACISFFVPTFPTLSNVTHLVIEPESLQAIGPLEYGKFFEIISSKLPNLEWLDLTNEILVRESLLSVLRLPLTRLDLFCSNPASSQFADWKWVESLTSLTLNFSGICGTRNDNSMLSPHLDLDYDIHLPDSLTYFSTNQPLGFLSPNGDTEWPQHLVEINICDLHLEERDVVLWKSLPLGLLKLKIDVHEGAGNLFANAEFVESLQRIPNRLQSFKLYHPLYDNFVENRLYRNKAGKFEFPKCLANLAKRRPKLACIKISGMHMDLSEDSCNNRLFGQESCEMLVHQSGSRKSPKLMDDDTPYDRLDL